MNPAQRNIKKLMAVATSAVEQEYLQKAYDLWEPYTWDQWSYPKWGLWELEQKYGMNTNDIRNKYNIDLWNTK